MKPLKAGMLHKIFKIIIFCGVLSLYSCTNENVLYNEPVLVYMNIGKEVNGIAEKISITDDFLIVKYDDGKIDHYNINEINYFRVIKIK